jgi:hypothetical protein
MATFSKKQAKELYELTEEELNIIPHKIDKTSSLKKYIYSKQELDNYIVANPRVFSKKNTLHKKEAMITFFLNETDILNIPFNMSNGRYYFKIDDLLAYANNKYGFEELKKKFKDREDSEKLKYEMRIKQQENDRLIRKIKEAKQDYKPKAFNNSWSSGDLALDLLEFSTGYLLEN